MRHENLPQNTHEFSVVPAPKKGERVQGLKTDDARMAHTLTLLFNEMAADGWEYVRADILPNTASADPSGTSAKTMTLLVFRRPLRGTSPLILSDPVEPMIRVESHAPSPHIA